VFTGGIDAGHAVLVTGNPDGRKKTRHVERPGSLRKRLVELIPEKEEGCERGHGEHAERADEEPGAFVHRLFRKGKKNAESITPLCDGLQYIDSRLFKQGIGSHLTAQDRCATQNL
jgi:hypothetical protein